MATWGTVSTWRQRFLTHSETMLPCCLCYKRKRELLLHFKNLLFWKLEKFFSLKFPKKYKCWYFLHHLKMPLQRWRIFRDFPAILYVFNYINHLNLCENKKNCYILFMNIPCCAYINLRSLKCELLIYMDGYAYITCLYIVHLWRQQGGAIIISKKECLLKQKMNIILSMKQNHRIVIDNVNDNTCIV